MLKKCIVGFLWTRSGEVSLPVYALKGAPLPHDPNNKREFLPFPSWCSRWCTYDTKLQKEAFRFPSLTSSAALSKLERRKNTSDHKLTNCSTKEKISLWKWQTVELERPQVARRKQQKVISPIFTPNHMFLPQKGQVEMSLLFFLYLLCLYLRHLKWMLNITVPERVRGSSH